MKRKNGGYLIIDLTSTTLVEDLEIAGANDKPILVYDSNGKGNFYTLKVGINGYLLIGPELTYAISEDGNIISAKTDNSTLWIAELGVNLTLPSGYTKTSGDIHIIYYHKKALDSEKQYTRDELNLKRIVLPLNQTCVLNDGTNAKTISCINLNSATNCIITFTDGTTITATINYLSVVRDYEITL